MAVRVVPGPTAGQGWESRLSNDCFISYRRSTSAFVARCIYQDLRANNIDTFMDVETLGAGDFRHAITHEISRRPYFLPVLTPAALRRCSEPDDVLLMEYIAAVEAGARFVPLVTPEFDRSEIRQCLPADVAAEVERVTSIKVDHEEFDAGMTKLRERFLVRVPVAPPADLEFRREDVTRVQQAADNAPRFGSLALIVQQHLDHAYTLANDEPELAAKEMEAAAARVNAARGDPALKDELMLAMIELQAAMQGQQQELTRLSNEMKARHDAAMQSIRNIR